ncbi:hypothetical protein ACOME3_009854 [Neoechinorhynchus agilis]
MPLFKGRQKPADVVRSLRDNLHVLEKGGKNIDKAHDEISKHLTTIKGMLYGTPEQDPQSELIATLAQEIYASNLLLTLITNLTRVSFEDKKEMANIFNNMLRRQIGKVYPTVDYIMAHKQILQTLIRGYENSEIALNCGTMLRECARHEELAKEVLESGDFYNFFAYAQMNTFDVSSDAFSTFKEFLVRHRAMSAAYIQENYDLFFSNYERLLLSDNYVTRRQSLKLLGELMLDRNFTDVMYRFIENVDNLKMMMNLFREKSSHIQFETFHVFKIFVANPNKPKAIFDILLRNRERLIDFLLGFTADRADDEQFNEEKAYLIKQIRDLKPDKSSNGGVFQTSSNMGDHELVAPGDVERPPAVNTTTTNDTIKAPSPSPRSDHCDSKNGHSEQTSKF